MTYGAAALAALAVATAGCGGGGGKALDYPQFQRAANAVCRRYSHAVDTLAQPRTLSAVAGLARRAYALGQAERAALARIRPPGAAAAGYATFLARTRGADELLPQLRSAASRGDQPAVARFAKRGRADARAANATAARLGLDDCRRR